MKKIPKITCPHCGKEIVVDETVMSEVNDNFRHEIEQTRQSIRKEVEQGSLFQMREKEKIIDDLKSQLDEALRRANQGSVQRQGELQEQEIIKILQESFPTDEITQSKKGSNGADVMQIVKSPEGQVCGKIYYESKNTKSWSNDWIPKFKSDNLQAKADVLVIITNALPKNVERCALQDGVWICSFNYFRELSMALRYSLLKLHSVVRLQDGRESKMEQLYSYLTSETFKNVFESILDGFQTIKESHQSEQVTLKRMWTKREKIMEQILFNSLEFYGNVREIAGTAIREVPMLETPASKD